MTKQEAIKIIALIVGSYPAAGDLKKDDTVNAMVLSWAAVFKDDDANLVGMAVHKHIALNKWPPSVAEIRAQMVSISHPELIPPEDAWAAVSDLLYASSDYEVGAYKSLPPLIVRCVEAIGWHNLRDMQRGSYGDCKPGMARLAFIQQYTPMYERERDLLQLPGPLKAQCEKVRQALGGEAIRQIDAAHQQRIEKDAQWDRMRGIPRLKGKRAPALPGGEADES